MKRDNDLYPFKRHLRTCSYFGPGGRDVRMDKCNCPFHADGSHNGVRVRQSLKTRSRQVAERRVADIIKTLDQQTARENSNPGVKSSARTPEQRTVQEAVERFLRSHGQVGPDGKYQGDLEYGTWRKYRSSLGLFASFCETDRVSRLVDVSMETIEDYRATRQIALVTWRVELQALRTFFTYCVSHKWLTANPAKEIRGPRNVKPNDVVPYTLSEECQILAAADQIGIGAYNRTGATYERLRARAMVLTLRHTALRVADVCTLRRDAISWDEPNNTWRILLRTQKSGQPVYLPIPEQMKLALDAVPLPRNGPQDCPCFFWNGHTSRRAVVGIGERTLSAVFKRSGVKNAHAHRYRHTLATRLLEMGATFEQVADILGNSPAVVRKHYGKWAKGRQDSIDRLMIAHFQTASATSSVTKQSHEKTRPVN